MILDGIEPFKENRMNKMKIKTFVKGIIRFLAVKATWLKWHNVIDLGQNVVLVDCKISKKLGGVKIGTGSTLWGCSFVFNGEKGNSLSIGEHVALVGAEFILRNGGDNTIIIGNGTTTGGNVQFAACEGKSIAIGEDCQFAHNIALWTTDHHPIYDESKNRINPAKDITLGKHIWVGTDTLILKGVKIADGIVVGAKSVVTKALTEEKSVYVGNPCKKVKNNVFWEREFLTFEK